MSVFKRTRRTPSGELVEISPFWHYRFLRNGIPVFINTKQKDKDTAKTMEADHRKRLAMDEVGLPAGKAPNIENVCGQIH